MTGAAFVVGNEWALLDGLLGVGLVVHSHIGVSCLLSFLSYPFVFVSVFVFVFVFVFHHFTNTIAITKFFLSCPRISSFRFTVKKHTIDAA